MANGVYHLWVVIIDVATADTHVTPLCLISRYPQLYLSSTHAAEVGQLPLWFWWLHLVNERQS